MEPIETYLNTECERLSFGDDHDPHALLGLHFCTKEGITQRVVRLFRPGASQVYFELFGSIVEAKKTHDEGFFEYPVPTTATALDYRVYHQNGLLAQDPYAFLPTLSDFDCYLFGQGVHYQLYQKLGAHPTVHNQIPGVRFAVWAPSAKRVSLVGDFNFWNGRMNPMRSLGGSGIWEIFIPGLTVGAKYKFEIKSQAGEIALKSDPYAFYSELRPSTASIVASTESFPWTDDEWLNQRKDQAQKATPLLIYEVHLGSWKRENGQFLNYRKLAVELAEHCKKMNFTHVELMPIQEHPLDESWGYQVSGFYAPTSRHGSPEDFQWFVNHLHREGIGIILDWVPGHFPTDAFSIGRFDGTALYEHEDKRQGFHPHWNTFIFNFGRKEVVNFLIANALYWLQQMHIDGLRVDAVASMLYLDYGRNKGEWIPNKYGGHENLEAIEFFKHLNSVVHEKVPGILMIAEESTSFAGVSHPVVNGGLGFDLKWNMGWMNDTLRYFSTDMLFRHYHQNDLTFGLLYAFSERFLLVLSHDEVVHGKKSLLGKMPGDFWQQFANMRLLYSYMICQPGKKLLFMGGEIGQWNEWNCKSEIEWFLLKFPIHSGLQTLIQELNRFYLDHSSLWEHDFDYTGFEWVDFRDSQNSVVCYLRKGYGHFLLCVHNFTPVFHSHYTINLGNVTSIQEIFNTDAIHYGGSGKQNQNIRILKTFEGNSYGVEIALAPLATQIFEVVF
ncbi:MAG: 1,4-alpha-glucan branching protein GlgB [Parachlamydiaceae bacterium]|nr:1,4-alpha-glucan branching protein GlgB [Parachlamydiaceae bacterium]